MHVQPWGAPCLPAFGKRGISLEEKICPLWVQGVVIVVGSHFSQKDTKLGLSGSPPGRKRPRAVGGASLLQHS